MHSLVLWVMAHRIRPDWSWFEDTVYDRVQKFHPKNVLLLAEQETTVGQHAARFAEHYGHDLIQMRLNREGRSRYASQDRNRWFANQAEELLLFVPELPPASFWSAIAHNGRLKLNAVKSPFEFFVEDYTLCPVPMSDQDLSIPIPMSM